jgi:hypothetical protein
MTVNRRLHRALRLLAAELGDLYPGGDDPTPTDPADGATA